MRDEPEFDAADLAADILGLDEAERPNEAEPPTIVSASMPSGRPPGTMLGWLLVVALVLAVTVAISMAVQLSNDSSTGTGPSPCGGLFSDCCDGDQFPTRCDEPSTCGGLFSDCCDGDQFGTRCGDRCEDDGRLPRERDGRGLFDAGDSYAEQYSDRNC